MTEDTLFVAADDGRTPDTHKFMTNKLDANNENFVGDDSAREDKTLPDGTSQHVDVWSFVYPQI